MMITVRRDWLLIRDCREEDKWDNGYHEFMVFSGFLWGLPPIITLMGSGLACCGAYGLIYGF